MHRDRKKYFQSKYLLLIPLVMLIACLQNPTPEELGINFIVRTDKIYYKQGEPITISFLNIGAARVRIVEQLVKEGQTITYFKAPRFFLKVLEADGKWKPAAPYIANYGSQFPYHMRPGETFEWTSKKLSTKFHGRKIKFVIEYRDAAMNQHSFTAESPPVEIGD